MSNTATIYKRWVPEWLKLPLLLIALVPHLMLMSLFHSNATFSASFLGVETQDLQFLLSLMYGSVVVALLLVGRLLAYIPVRSYILLMYLAAIVILFAMSITSDYRIMAGLRLIEGIFGLLQGTVFLQLATPLIKSAHARVIGFLILYAIMLTGGSFTTSLVQGAIANYGWQEMIYIFIAFQFLVVLIALLLFNKNRFIRKYPLYQFDYASCIFLLIALHSGAYAVIYGYKYYWFSSPAIVIAALTCLLFSGLFIYKQSQEKRPLFNFNVFKSRELKQGVLVFFLFYIIRSGLHNVYGIMASVWNWPWQYIVNIQYFNVVGTVIGVAASGYLFIKGKSIRMIFAVAFFLFGLNCLGFTFIFYPDTNITYIGSLLFMQGFCQGWLFTPLVMYMIGGVPPKLIGNAAFVGTSIRFWSTNIGFAIINQATDMLNQKHMQNLTGKMDNSNPQLLDYWNSLLLQFSRNNDARTATGLAAKKLYGQVHDQSLLLSNMEIFTALAIVSLLGFLYVLFYTHVTLLYKKLLHCIKFAGISQPG
jgi:hypothetical protein